MISIEMILEGFLGLKNHTAGLAFVKELSREMFVLHMVQHVVLPRPSFSTHLTLKPLVLSCHIAQENLPVCTRHISPERLTALLLEPMSRGLNLLCFQND